MINAELNKKFQENYIKSLNVINKDEKKEYFIISNNDMALQKYSNTICIEDSFIDVLIATREYVLNGYRIVSHPLPASIRMIYSPVRSIIITKDNNIDDFSLEIIESSIEKYQTTIGKRNIDIKNKKDYEIIDLDLLESAIEENDFIMSSKNI